MNDFEIILAMAAACELFIDFSVAEVRQLLSPFEAHRFERLMAEVFAVQEASWTGLAGDEAATAVGLVAAMVDSGDLPRPRGALGQA
jgi:hypothetical protein